MRLTHVIRFGIPSGSTKTFSITFIYACACSQMTGTGMKDRVQLWGVSSLLPSWGSWDLTQVSRLGGKKPLPMKLSCLNPPTPFYFEAGSQVAQAGFKLAI